MDTFDALRARRNVRSYSGRAIGEDELHRVLEAGWRAPSAANRQRRDLVVVTERAQLAELATVSESAGHVATSAATIALVTPVTGDLGDQLFDQYDLGQATMAMAVCAADLGIGSGHASVGDQAAARRLLGLPEDRKCAYLLALGYPADRPLAPIRRPRRRPFDEVVHRARW